MICHCSPALQTIHQQSVEKFVAGPSGMTFFEAAEDKVWHVLGGQTCVRFKVPDFRPETNATATKTRK